MQICPTPAYNHLDALDQKTDLADLDWGDSFGHPSSNSYFFLLVSADIWFLTFHCPTTFTLRNGSERISTSSISIHYTDIQTPTGTRSCSWYAGPARQPAGDDPPPNRPILVIVDYSALQNLSHASEANSATCRALRPGNFRCASTGE